MRLYAGYCIGGPWHGQAHLTEYRHIEVVIFPYCCPARSSPEVTAVDRVIYRHLRNEYGDWWIIP